MQIAGGASTYGNLDLGPALGAQASTALDADPLRDSGTRNRPAGAGKAPRMRRSSQTGQTMSGRRTQPRHMRQSRPGGGATANTVQGVGASQVAAADPTAGMHAAGGLKMLDGDPLNSNFDASAPALELAVDNARATPEPAERESEKRKKVEKRKESPAELRARQVRELADYGSAPQKIWQAIPYCVRVTMRKKELEQQLAALSAQRKRAEDGAQEALGKMGHALYALRHDPRMRPLAPKLKVIAQSASTIGETEALGEQRQKTMKKELAGVARELEKEEGLAKPLREQDARLGAQLDDMKGRVQQAQLVVKKLEGDLDAVRSGKLKVDAERFGVMQAERDARHGELQTLGVQMRPLEEELAAVRGKLQKHLRAIATLQGEAAQTESAMQRAEHQLRVSSGSAQSNYRDALISLAKEALEQNLAGLAPEHAGAAADGVIAADKKRKEEDLYRAATLSYDEGMYKKGVVILLGGSAAFFLSFAIMVLF
jgi:hypothetical protein